MKRPEGVFERENKAERDGNGRMSKLFRVQIFFLQRSSDGTINASSCNNL